MSDMSRESLGVQTALPIPGDSPVIPSFCEAIPGDSQVIPTAPYRFPVPALYSGNRESVPPETTITGASRKAKIRVHSCHSPILAGLDADVAAFAVAVDPYALTAVGEVAALRDSRRTYDLEQGRLSRRDAWTIRGRPPVPRRAVLAEHRCGHPIPDDWKAPPAPPAPRPEVEF